MGSMIQFCAEAEPATARIFRVVYKFIWNAKGLTSSNLRFRTPVGDYIFYFFLSLLLSPAGRSR